MVIVLNKLDQFVCHDHFVNLNQSYISACSDVDFLKYVKNLKIEEDLLIKYTSSLMDCVQERKMSEMFLFF